MALVILGPLVGRLSGKIGGVTFTQGKGPPHATFTPRKRRKSSSHALHARNAFTNCIQGWSKISAANKNAWKTLAATLTVNNRFGTPTPMTGQQLFVRANMVRTMTDGSPSIVLPTSIEKYRALGQNASMTDAPLYRYRRSVYLPAAPSFSLLYAQRSFSENHWRSNSLVFIHSDMTTQYPNWIDFTADFIARLGAAPPDERIALQLRYMPLQGVPTKFQPIYITVTEA